MTIIKKKKKKSKKNESVIVYNEEYLLNNGIDYNKGVELLGDLETYKDMLSLLVLLINTNRSLFVFAQQKRNKFIYKLLFILDLNVDILYLFIYVLISKTVSKRPFIYPTPILFKYRGVTY